MTLKLLSWAALALAGRHASSTARRHTANYRVISLEQYKLDHQPVRQVPC